MKAAVDHDYTPPLTIDDVEHARNKAPRVVLTV